MIRAIWSWMWSFRVAVAAGAPQPAVTISPAASNGAAPAHPPVTVVGSAGHRETTLIQPPAGSSLVTIRARITELAQPLRLHASSRRVSAADEPPPRSSLQTKRPSTICRHRSTIRAAAWTGTDHKEQRQIGGYLCAGRGSEPITQRHPA